MDSQLKVSRAVTKAAFAKPFYGSLMLTLDVHQDDNIDTACTDGRFIKWNDAFIQEQTEPKTLGLMAHEVMHVALQHCQDWSPKDPKMCNIAMDIVINRTLIDDGFELPDCVIQPEPRFTGMTWQQVYNIIKDEEKYQDMAKDPDFGDLINNSDLSDAEKEELKQEIEQKVIQAAEAQKASGIGDLPAGIEDLIKEIRQSKIDWKSLLRADLQCNFPDDFSFNKPNKKFLGTYGIYMPTMVGHKIRNLGVGLDTSGSMTTEDHIRQLSEINAICLELQPENVYLFYTDCDVAKVEDYGPGEVIDVLKTRGGGGTSFVPVFDYIEKTGLDVDQLIYMSDMDVWEDCFPTTPPEYPVVWLSTRSDYSVPFGNLIHVQEGV